MLTVFSDDYFMGQAIKEAEKAAASGEVPVGAVIVCQQQIIARAHNQTQLLNDVTAHAEIIAITAASSYLGSKYLNGCTLFVTLEPCIMCAGALYWSKIDKLVYGASDEKRGFMKYGKELLHPSTKLEFGIKHDQCSHMMSSFFESKRNK
ncbi:MAG: nucleoside deaminase [Saprospiraceae bacterium]